MIRGVRPSLASENSIHEAGPEVVEQAKWRKSSNPAGVPMRFHAEIICIIETYKSIVKMTFAKGALAYDVIDRALEQVVSAVP